MSLEDKMFLYASRFNGEHKELYANSINNAAAPAWMGKNIPLFECDDPEIEETYYFRFWTFRKHIKETSEGCVITEYMPDVAWAGPYNTVSCSVGHHINEGRWLRDKSVIESDIRFFLKPENARHTLNFSSSVLQSTCNYILFTGNTAFAREMLDSMISLYGKQEEKSLTECGLFYSSDLNDGMEYSISGAGLRPTLNTYMYGAARGIADVCCLIDDIRGVIFARKARELRKNIRKYLWDEKDGFFKTVPMNCRDSVPDFARTDENRNVREEAGFIPFSEPGLVSEMNLKALPALCDEKIFSAPCGITTADMSHPRFQKNTVHHECLWDGPVFPYATSQTLTSVYTLLSVKKNRYITPVQYMSMLKKYALSQRRYEHGLEIKWIDENIDPFSGQWVSRDLLYLDRSYMVPAERGADCNRSTFCDLVLSGACGVHPSTDPGTGKMTLTVKPLCMALWRYFAVENIEIGGHLYSVYFDRNKKHYGLGSVLTLFRDGKAVAAGEDELIYKL